MPVTPANGQSKRSSGRSWPVLATLITIIAVAIMVSLGCWQLARMEQKQQRLHSIAQKAAQAPMQVSQALQSFSDVRDIPVSFSAEVDSSRAILLDNQVYQGKPGYAVIVPVRSQEQQFLVNLGWVPAPAQRDQLPDIVMPANVFNMEGVISVPGNNRLISETATQFNTFPLRLQQIDIANLNFQWGTSMPNILVQRIASAPDLTGFTPVWQAVVMPPEKHLGYAIQWFGLALAAVVIFFSVLMRRANNNDNYGSDSRKA
nr:SURF1 family protein [Aestuariibacter sp. GS-14]